MSEKIKAVIITGIFGLVAAAVTGFLSYNAGSNSVSATAANSNNIAISFSGENDSVTPDGYDEIKIMNSRLLEENKALKNENDRLKQALNNEKTLEQASDSEDMAFMLDVAPAYESYHYKEYSRGGSKATSFYIAGQQYYNGLVWSAWNTGYSLHSLDGKYVEITGLLGHIDQSDMGEGSLQIYFDGVLHKEIPLSGEMVAQPFSIDVTGVHQLKLMVSHSRGSYGYADVTIY